MTRQRILITVALVLVSGAGALGFCWLAIRESTNALLMRAHKALGADQYEKSEQLAKEILARDPQHDEALFIAGVSARESGRYPDAVVYFDRVSETHSKAAEARFQAGDLLILRLFQPTPAEERLRKAVQLQPALGSARQHLSALWGLCGDTQTALQFRLARVRLGNFSDVDLLVLALGESVDDATMREKIVRASPNDPLTWLMQAQVAIQNRDLSTAEELLRRVLKQRSDLLVAHAKLGRVLLDRGDHAGLRAWFEQLPSGADQSQDLWLLRGDWARQLGNDPEAAHCYSEALLIDPASQRGNYQLGQLLTSMGEGKEAEVYVERANHLHELTIAAQAYLKANTPVAVERLVKITRRSHLEWEAWGWSQIARSLKAPSKTLPDIDQPKSGASRVPGSESGLERLIGKYPRPRFPRGSGTGNTVIVNAQAATKGMSQITFTDDAQTAGVHFQYVPGDRPGEVGLRMFQFSGGGVAVLDFDQDGWPDLYLPQGHLWPVKESDLVVGSTTLDRLFRNLGNGKFADATDLGELTGRGYGQGVTVGDFNSDGFPDVYVATLSENRLYRNNGDGTLTDVTEESGTAGERWTTSCLMADLNGDGLPDIYAVNYLEDPNLLERVCRNPDGRDRRCSPFELEASQDQLYLNRGDGRFEEVTSEAGIVSPGGKGLGIVAADFEGSGHLSLFVANDMMPNFYFMNETASPGARPRFKESALTAGLAYDRDGRAQGCMGIAVGDAQGDGLLDLFVTNYYLESNTFYQQHSGQSFEDVTPRVGLREPSLKMLGFGTQFLDADLDGWPDLIVTNGHVDDETYREIPFHMPPQFFRNSGEGRFEELSTSRLGPWFSGKYLGRGLARLDWNRDGREDFVVSNLDSPVALLTNRTKKPGNSIRLQLRGIQSNRDAIGVTVRVRIGNREYVQQLTAGDGYESSNQRQLVFGLGEAKFAEVVTIRWPGGTTQQFVDVRTGNEYQVIEGRPTFLELPVLTSATE